MMGCCSSFSFDDERYSASNRALCSQDSHRRYDASSDPKRARARSTCLYSHVTSTAAAMAHTTDQAPQVPSDGRPWMSFQLTCPSQRQRRRSREGTWTEGRNRSCDDSCECPRKTADCRVPRRSSSADDGRSRPGLCQSLPRGLWTVREGRIG